MANKIISFSDQEQMQIEALVIDFFVNDGEGPCGSWPTGWTASRPITAMPAVPRRRQPLRDS
jgi:hypothetical protein